LGSLADTGIFALLAGRSGGQHLKGGTDSGDDLILESTNHGTKGDVLIQPNGGNTGFGESAPHTPVYVRQDVDGDSSVLGIGNLAGGAGSTNETARIIFNLSHNGSSKWGGGQIVAGKLGDY